MLAHTDEEGRLRLRQDLEPGLGTTELCMTVTQGGFFGRVSAPLTPGESTLEDLLLVPMPVLASGQVLDLEGKPAVGAQVFALDEIEWESPRTETDARGEFVLRVPRTTLGSGSQRLLAKHGEHLSTIVTAANGARDLSLLLSSAPGGLTGKVLLDPEVPAERVHVQLYASELGQYQSGLGLFELEDRLDARGGFSLADRVPGRHRARFLVDDQQVLELDDTFVEAGTLGTDPRLAPLDLRGRIHVRRIRLVAPEGGAEPRGQYLVHCTGEGWGANAPFEGPELLVLSPDPAPDVEIFAEGFRTLRLERVREDRSVHLQAGWPVRLLLEEGIALPELPVTWSVVLLGENLVSSFPPPIRFEPGRREARGVAPEVGELEVGWIRRAGKADEPPAPFGLVRGGEGGWPRQIVVVRDVPGEQVLHLGWVPVAR